MLHEDPFKAFAAHSNTRLSSLSAQDILQHVLDTDAFGPTALVSSFGADSIVLLHMLSLVAPDTPVLFIDTLLLFDETLSYQIRVARELRLSNVQIIRADRQDLFNADNEGLLHLHDPDACCALRKTKPLENALTNYGSWISGRKRYQAASRTTLNVAEFDDETKKLKINPLAHWSREDIAEYIERNNLPRHPLLKAGYRSIGCSPCTTPVHAHEDERAGRWRDTPKTECGIHFGSNRQQREQNIGAPNAHRK